MVENGLNLCLWTVIPEITLCPFMYKVTQRTSGWPLWVGNIDEVGLCRLWCV